MNVQLQRCHFTRYFFNRRRNRPGQAGRTMHSSYMKRAYMSADCVTVFPPFHHQHHLTGSGSSMASALGMRNVSFVFQHAIPFQICGPRVSSHHVVYSMPFILYFPSNACRVENMFSAVHPVFLARRNDLTSRMSGRRMKRPSSIRLMSARRSTAFNPYCNAHSQNRHIRRFPGWRN